MRNPQHLTSTPRPGPTGCGILREAAFLALLATAIGVTAVSAWAQGLEQTYLRSEPPAAALLAAALARQTRPDGPTTCAAKTHPAGQQGCSRAAREAPSKQRQIRQASPSPPSIDGP
jgi:hypothetical protein